MEFLQGPLVQGPSCIFSNVYVLRGVVGVPTLSAPGVGPAVMEPRRGVGDGTPEALH